MDEKRALVDVIFHKSGEHKICQIEFNNRKFNIRDMLKLLNSLKFKVIDIEIGKTHTTCIFEDCYECVYADGIIVGMNVYEREPILINDLTSGVTIVKFKCVNYFNEDCRKKHAAKNNLMESFLEEKKEKYTSKQNKMSGSLPSPQSDSDESFESFIINRSSSK